MNEDIFAGGSYYDDDGNELNPDNFPKPPLCLICRINESIDAEDTVLCNLTRLDQSDGKPFNCYSFVQKTIM
jgi:hypothetical protein